MAEPAITHEDRAEYLRCLIYDLYVLATAVGEWENTDDYGLGEVYKTAALLKLRAVHDFFFRPEATDSIKLSMFGCYDPKAPQTNPLPQKNWLTLQSIHTFVVHLDTARVPKKYEKDNPKTGAKEGDTLEQPKFKKGKQAVIDASKQLMKQAETFVESILNHKEFPGLDSLGKCGKRYWVGFQESYTK